MMNLIPQFIILNKRLDMSFMQKQIYFGSYFEVETTCGTEIVPCDVIGRTISTHVEALFNYLVGDPTDSEELCEVKEGWLARMSAPGYLDCTEWSAYKTEAQAVQALDDMYGED
jgi:hypothetical protein